MGEYLNKYKKYLEELQTRQSSVKTKYRNKVIKDVNGDHYFVNNMGIARKFTASCSGLVKIILVQILLIQLVLLNFHK